MKVINSFNVSIGSAVCTHGSRVKVLKFVVLGKRRVGSLCLDILVS
jgi:hypothetical protein